MKRTQILIPGYLCFFMLLVFQFEPDGTAGTVNGSRDPLKFPWAGGLNSCQFCAIDLNNDGIRDLLIFDRHGNRKLTFINHGTPNTIDYTFEPSYALLLPEMKEWVITADFNCDGKMDIFTYGTGGLRVFKNTSVTSLEFTLVTDLLESFYYTGKVGILVTSVDYPAITDIDNDGDLDLLTFFGLGSYVEYHQNLSMEKYGHCDSLDFRLADPCWGKFKESEGGNRITLNAPCPYSELRITNYELRNEGERHTGSTMLVIDLDNNGLKDLILGDMDYPELIALYNGGTIDSAFMVAQDTIYPVDDVPVRLFSFPLASYLDIDNDGLNDLIVSPFDASLKTSDNYNCVWFYKNTGTVSYPQFGKQSEVLFRHEMMDFGSASHPVLYDFDGDGLQDLFVGNYGIYQTSWYFQAVLYSSYASSIDFFRNTGTNSSPVFTFTESADLAGINAMGLMGAYPAVGDLNGDGRPDLLLGNSDGTLILFTNQGSQSGIPEFNPPEMNWHGIDVGNYSTPQLFDLDKDNLPDLIIGEQNGNLNYYKNTGDNHFVWVTDSLGRINVTNYALSYNGYSTPCFARKSDGTTFLVVGSEEGCIHLFEDIDHNLDGRFTPAEGLFDWLSATPNDTLFGWQTSPALLHVAEEDSFDLITGNFSGGLNYITKRTPAIIIPGTPKKLITDNRPLNLSPNPADHSVTISTPGLSVHKTPCKLTIHNLQGQKIMEIPYAGEATITISDLPAGVYIVRAGNHTAKMIILHP